jgi:carboxypeptidase C (cathepsin A)
MTAMRLIFNMAAAVLALQTALAVAQTTQSADPTARTTTRPATTQAGDKIVITRHELKLGERTLRYTASAGTMVQRDEAGAAKVDMFFVAYTLERDENATPQTRPIMFIFNGGPGAASVWLHLGTAGPKRIDLNEQNIQSRPPFGLIDNDATWLDASDLVFIDPVGTGYSRPAAGEKGEQFYGVQEDVRSVGSFIRLYVTRNGRWLSPKFLAGESYGTTRAAGLSQYLLDQCGISLNGIVLISSALNFQTFATGAGNDVGFAMYLPTYAALAWYHKRLNPAVGDDLQRLLHEVEQWVLNEYLPALAKGDSLSDSQRQQIAQKLSAYTSLNTDYILKSNLRINPARFRKMLLAGRNQIIGRFDGRVSAFDPDPAGEEADFDPSYSRVLPIYAACLNSYVRQTLNFESDLPYEVLTERVQPWNFGNNGFGYLNVAPALRDTMLKNPHLKVLFAAGRMDLATPYLGSDYTIDHLQLPAEIRGNITRVYFPAGHMMYHDPESRLGLHEHIVKFVAQSIEDARGE